MKSYPSISRSVGTSFREFDAYVFDKVDGSNLRWEWDKKKGWGKFGTRTRLFDLTDPVFGCAIPLFLEGPLAKGLEAVFRSQRWERAIAFTEFWGARSFAGQHESEDEKFLTLFDVAPHKKGILGPVEYLGLFSHLPIARFLGRQRWTRGFVERVRASEIEGVTDEGVVGKTGSGHELIMAKAKTQSWIDRVVARYGVEASEKII